MTSSPLVPAIVSKPAPPSMTSIDCMLARLEVTRIVSLPLEPWTVS